MWKKHDLVMLATNEKANIFLTQGKLYYSPFDDSIPKNNAKNQHLYILSSEEIKESDWCYLDNNIKELPDYNGNHIIQISKEQIESANIVRDCKKIIATTDKSLKIKNPTFQGYNLPDSIFPQLSQSFIEHFVSEYNKGNIITKVMVEYEANLSDSPYTSNKQNNALKALKESSGIGCKLKINSDNTINIKPIKDSWSKKEQFEKIIKFRDDYEKFKKNYYFGPNNKEIDEWTNNWIEQNL